MANAYYLGDRVKIQTSTPFTDVETDTATDPAVVRMKVRSPSGTSTTYTYGDDDDVERVAAGDYQMYVNASEVGDWYYRIEGESADGNYMGAFEGWFSVKATEFS